MAELKGCHRMGLITAHPETSFPVPGPLTCFSPFLWISSCINFSQSWDYLKKGLGGLVQRHCHHERLCFLKRSISLLSVWTYELLSTASLGELFLNSQKEQNIERGISICCWNSCREEQAETHCGSPLPAPWLTRQQDPESLTHAQAAYQMLEITPEDEDWWVTIKTMVWA